MSDRLLSLLPVHVGARDDATADRLLRSLLDAVAAELTVLEEDVEELYESWFIETCPQWVVPYLADLVGVPDLPADPHGEEGAAPEGAGSRRAVVANTVAYRRRKGTVAVLEQVARDVTGWPARAVEFYRLLATSSHVNHVRLDRHATASLRGADALDSVPPAVAGGALDRLAHTGEVRRIATGRGRYGIANVGVFLFPLQVHESGWAPARGRSSGWSVHPLGYATPLFAPPATEEAIERLATEADLPVPLRPRRLRALLAAARAAEAAGAAPPALPVAVTVEGEGPLAASRLRVCGLEDLATDSGGGPLAGWQVMVDPVAGVLHTYADGAPRNPASVAVRHCYGATADVGAGTYDRSEVHEAVLTADPYSGDRQVRAQVELHADDPAGTSVNPLARALADAEDRWGAPDGSPAGATYVVALGDSGSYAGDLAVELPAATRLVLVAASWRERVLANGETLPPALGSYTPEGVRPHVRGTLTVSGAAGSSVVVDGLVVEGDILVGPGALRSLSVTQSTVTGRVRVEVAGDADNDQLQVSLLRAVVGGVDLAPTVPLLELRDAVVDASGVLAVTGAGAHLSVDGSTVRGDVEVRSLDATSAILDGTTTVEHRQTGCVRFSYVGPGSRVPRRYRCVPAADDAAVTPPVYSSQEPGSPTYLSLAVGCPEEIRTGGEHDTEMGVHAHLRRPPRVAAARRLLAPYVPVGSEIGMVGS